MADITALSNQLDAKTYECRTIIETPKGCRNKFDYDPDSSLFILGGLLPEGMMFPFDFGFIPSTLGDDGDPLNCQILENILSHLERKLREVMDAEIDTTDVIQSGGEVSTTLLSQV